jgi:hypothetical protein
MQTPANIGIAIVGSIIFLICCQAVEVSLTDIDAVSIIQLSIVLLPTVCRENAYFGF